MFLPQRPYLSPGTLRDQVIYPDGHVDMREKRKSEEDLKRILEEARLGYLPDREGGWDTRKEWKDVLSGGEKQRMGFARLLYHEPQYAVIDEGTSAVSSDVEGLLYETCKEKGISEYQAGKARGSLMTTRQLSSQYRRGHLSKSTTRSTLFSAWASTAMDGNSSGLGRSGRSCRWRRSFRSSGSGWRRWTSGRRGGKTLSASWLPCGPTRGRCWMGRS